MQTYIALLRGINVGGTSKLPMKILVPSLADTGLKDIQTYIQTGNLIFNHASNNISDIASEISGSIAVHHSLHPEVLVLTGKRLLQIIKDNPFPEATEAPSTLHLFFLKDRATAPNIDKLNLLKADSEYFKLTEHVFYLHAPEGIGRSKLAAGAEKAIGVPTTARNWRTASKTLEMVQG